MMINNKRFFKALTLALALSTLVPVGTSAKVIADTTTENNITVSMSKDGYFGLTSTNTGGRILYYTKSGETVDTLTSATYPMNTTVKFYDTDGSFISEDDSLGGKPIYSDNDFSNWIPLGYTLSVPKGSDFEKATGLAIMPPTKKLETVNEWFNGYKPTQKGYVQVNAVYQFNNGTYSSPVSKTFYYDKVLMETGNAPTLDVTERNRTSSSVAFNLDCKAGTNQIDLSYLYITLPNGSQEQVTVSGLSKQVDYTAKYNGKYTFLLGTLNGGKVKIEKEVTGLTYEFQPDESTVGKSYGYAVPTVTFSELPTTVINGASILLHIGTDMPCTLSYDGKTYENKKDFDIEITENGSYAFHLIGVNGMSTDSSIDVECFPNKGDVPISIGSYWNSGKKSNVFSGTKLPQTGGLALMTIILTGVATSGLGVYLIKRKKKEGDK